MAFQINDDEREALQGLRYLTRCLYYAGIRPFMDYKTKLVGVKRKISWQSLSEELYVEPVSGILKSETGSPNKQQIRRAAKELERNGLITIKSTSKNLIFECVLASSDKSVQNQADTRPYPHPDTLNLNNDAENKDTKINKKSQAVPPILAQADTHPISGINKENITTNVVIQKKRKTTVPVDFVVTERHRELANKNSWPNPDDEVEAFKDHHIHKGTLGTDWDRGFYTWLRNAKKFNARGNSNATSQQPKQSHHQQMCSRAIQRAKERYREESERLKLTDESN